MSVSLYMDHHVKAAITAGLRNRGVDVITCADDGTSRADDDQVLERATQGGKTDQGSHRAVLRHSRID
jgi:Domain of unknown function (DUF5615)